MFLINNIKKYGFKNLVSFFLGISLLMMSVLIFKQLNHPQSFENKAAERTITTINKGTPKWLETKVPLVKQLASANKLTVTKSNFINTLDPVKTGTWQGMTVKVVKNEMLPEKYGSSSGGLGVKGAETMSDNRLFFGGMNVLSIKNPQDTNWKNLVTYEFIPPSPAYVYTKYITQTNTNPYEVYFGSEDAVMRMKTDKTFELVMDPTDSRGYLRYVNVTPYSNTTGMVAYRTHELYYLENGSMRKWNTPYRPWYNMQDSIFSMFTDKSTNRTFGFIQEAFTSSSYQPQYKTYLYEFKFSIDPSVPLNITRLGQITTTSSYGIRGIRIEDKIVVGYRKDNPSQKMLYNLDILGNIYSIVPYFYDNGTDMTLSRFKNDKLSDISGFSVELKPADQPDNIWSTNSQVKGLSLGKISNLDDVNSGTYVNTGVFDRLLANSYVNDVTVDESGMVYTAHKYLYGNQENNGLITIFEPPLPTQTPTPTLACKTRPTCLDAVPRPCKIPEPVEGWCPPIKP